MSTAMVGALSSMVGAAFRQIDEALLAFDAACGRQFQLTAFQLLQLVGAMLAVFTLAMVTQVRWLVGFVHLCVGALMCCC